MNKFQKIVFAIFVVLSLSLALFGYYSLKNIKQPSIKALSLIPDNCDALLKFDNYSEFTNSLRNKNLLWQDLQHLSCFEKLEEHLNYFDSIIAANRILSDLILVNPIYLSIYSKNKFLITCNLVELSNEKSFKNSFIKIFNSNFIPLKTDIQNGVIGISNSEEYLKKLFDPKNSKLKENKNFAFLLNSANYSGVSVYVNNKLSSNLISNSYSLLNTKPDRIILNGIKIKDSTEFFGEENAKPLKDFDFLNNIPLICNAFEVFVIEDAEKIFETKTKTDWWDNINKKAMFNAKKQFYNNISESIIKVSMPSKTHALIINISDSIKINEILIYIKDSVKLSNKRINKINKGTLSFTSSTFSLLKLKELNYFVAFKNHLVFTENESDAEIFINAKDNNSSMLENKRFSQFAAKNFDSEFHYLNYKLISSSLKEEIPFGDQLTDSDLNHTKNISHCSYMASYKNNFINYRFNLSYSQENFSDEPNILWTKNADTIINSKPFLFKNHINKGNEIIFQSIDNTIYLQNATGKTLWKKLITEQIRSEVFVVDAFKNEKYQMLFNTDKYIHLIDRNGNYVQGFPLKLPAKATNKLCLFDYENKKELRLFIACSDNKIYNYSIWGTKQEGFKTFETAEEVSLPIKYCKVGLSDYLVTADRKGKIYAFSRRGDGRIDFKNKLVEKAENFEIEPGNLLSNTQIIYYDRKSNLIEKISLTDKKEIYKTSDSDGISIYSFDDFDRNKITDVIISYPDKLEVYDLNGTKIFTKNLTNTINPLTLNFYDLNKNGFVSIFDNINSSSFILNVEQKASKEYKSTQPALICDLFNDGKIYLLIVLEGELKCVKL